MAVTVTEFGDNTTCFQRGSVIPAGGIRIEAGCFTRADVTDLRIPTQFTEVISLVVNDGTVRVIDIPDITSGVIYASTSGTPSGTVVNYIACGF